MVVFIHTSPEGPFGRFNWEEEIAEQPTYKARWMAFQVPLRM